MKLWIVKANPWEPLDYNDDVTYAVQAWAEGQMSGGQQKLLWSWLVEYGCSRDHMSFRPDDKGGQRATDFAEGRRYIGQQVRKHLHLTPLPLNAPKEEAKPKKTRKRKAS